MDGMDGMDEGTGELIGLPNQSSEIATQDIGGEN
jgi:hypothetical protein